jgi:nicotinamidase-related amidase
MQEMFRTRSDWAFAAFHGPLPAICAICELAPRRTIFTRFIPPQQSREAAGAWREFYEQWPGMIRAELGEGKLQIARELLIFVKQGAGLFDKQTYSPWHGGQLQDFLSAHKSDTVILTGIETEMCVLATLLGAIDAGLRTILCTDGIESSAKPCHDAMMEVLQSRYGAQLEFASSAEFTAYARG